MRLFPPIILPSDFNPLRVKTVLLNLNTQELQKVYDACGRSVASVLLCFGIRQVMTKKSLAKALFDRDVVLTLEDAASAGVPVKQSIKQLEVSDYLFDLGDGFDPEKMMDDAVKQDFDPGIFSDMDIRELPKAPNFFEWVVGREFSNTTIFPRQFQIQLAFYEEYCPWCSDLKFVKDIHLSPFIGEDGYRRAWTNDEILERVQLYNFGKCPRCTRTWIDAYNDPAMPHRFPKEIDACVGQRAGKTRMAEHMMTYNEHRFHMLTPSPQQFFGEDATQKFSAIYTALEMSQAEDTLWGAYHLRKRMAPWWKTYHKWLDDHGKRKGVELYRIRDTYHFYLNTLMQSTLRPPFSKAMRGRTSYQGGIDEIGMFAKGEASIKANADEVHRSIGNSLLTLRGDANKLVKQGRLGVPTPGLFCISSPWELLDKIMSLIRTADKDPTRVAFHYSTWDFNPKLRRDSQEIASEFANDPIGAERDFGAIPPFAKDPFHSQKDTIEYITNTDRKPIFVQETLTHQLRSGKCVIWARPQRLTPDTVTPRIICLDAGESNNSFAITVWSLVDLPSPPMDEYGSDADDMDREYSSEDDRIAFEARRILEPKKPEKRGVVTYLQLDGAVEIQPFTDENERKFNVSFSRTWEECLKPLIQSLNIVGVISDRWNITQMMNSIEEMGVYTEQYSLIWPDFVDFKAKAESREVRLLKPERPITDVHENYHKALRGAPNLHLSVQFQTVRQVGRSVTKPSNGTDDLYRTAVLAHRFAFSEKATREIDHKVVTFYELLHRLGNVTRSSRAVAAVATRGQSSGAVSGVFSRTGGYLARGSGSSSGNIYTNVMTRGGSRK